MRAALEQARLAAERGEVPVGAVLVDADGVLLGATVLLHDAQPEASLEEKCEALHDEVTKDPLTISPVYTIQDALLVIQDARVGALPVVKEDGTLTGIISVRDLLRAFINVLGIGEPGTLLCILMEEKVGQLKKIVDAITEENISFGSVLVAR